MKNKKEKKQPVEFLRAKHMQHTREFIREVHSINNKNHIEPFRINDEVWILGKFKGIKLEKTPKNYIEWSYRTMKLSENYKLILKKFL